MTLLTEKDCESGVYNIASGDYKPLSVFVEEIKTVTGSSSELRFGMVPYGPHGPVNLTPDAAKIKRLGWNPAVSFKQGVTSIINRKE